MSATGKTTSVLIVGDDFDTASFLESSLSTLGFEVTQASSGLEALEKLRAGEFDVVLCEWTMPKMGGQELYNELEKSQPWVLSRICFLTSDPKLFSGKSFLGRTEMRHLAKPFAFDQLAGVINDILNDPQRDAPG